MVARIGLALAVLLLTAASIKLPPLSLIGTVIRSAPDVSFATISRDKPDSRENYFAGAKITSQFKVVKIEREKVTLVHEPTGEQYTLRTPPYDPSKTVKPGFTKTAKDGSRIEVQLSRKEVDVLLSNLMKVLTEDAGSEIAKDKNGQILGFRLTYVKPGGVFAKLGLSEGDTIKSVNGKAITGLDVALELLNQLRDSSLIEVDIERAGKKLSVDYEIR